MEQHETEAALLPNIANQMRSLLSNLYLAASQVIPPEQREQDPALDAKAAILEQSFFRLLRLVNSMSAAECLSDSQTLSLRDAEICLCHGSAGLRHSSCRRGADALSPAFQRAEIYTCRRHRHGGTEKKR